MTEAVTPRDEVSAHWWDHRPVFSVTDRASRLTGLAPGRAPGRVTARLLAPALLTGLVWAAEALVASWLLCRATAGSCTAGQSGGWLVAGVLVLGYLAVLGTVGLAEHARETFGQRRAASLWSWAPLLAGVALGAGGGAVARVATADDPAARVRETLDGAPGTEGVLIPAVVAVLAAGWGLTIAARLPGALRHARGRQETIERLRRDSLRYTGRLRLGEVRLWLHNDPELDVTVVYDTPAGRREVTARMRTSADRVPVDGSAVVVLDDLRGALHVELDPDADPVFAPEQRYTPSE
ncbi:hypothetical protein [Promicromonospora sp. NPDC050880]|uniref:hypothetical protein n=1 Tax=Promicromonospora sp. NPDC050880 TaxID=3364406 RepID=UPI0037A59363